jgi:hypothetical protein
VGTARWLPFTARAAVGVAHPTRLGIEIGIGIDIDRDFDFDGAPR